MARSESLCHPNNMPASLPSYQPQSFTSPALNLGLLVSTAFLELFWASTLQSENGNPESREKMLVECNEWGVVLWAPSYSPPLSSGLPTLLSPHPQPGCLSLRKGAIASLPLLSKLGLWSLIPILASLPATHPKYLLSALQPLVPLDSSCHNPISQTKA